MRLPTRVIAEYGTPCGNSRHLDRADLAESVVLGAFLIVIVQIGMNLMRSGSCMQRVPLGTLLILAVVIDQLRHKMLVGSR